MSTQQFLSNNGLIVFVPQLGEELAPETQYKNVHQGDRKVSVTIIDNDTYRDYIKSIKLHTV